MDLATHEQLVRLAERRVLRARHKAEAADSEHTEAVHALNAACAARAAWIASNPDDQLMML